MTDVNTTSFLLGSNAWFHTFCLKTKRLASDQNEYSARKEMNSIFLVGNKQSVHEDGFCYNIDWPHMNKTPKMFKLTEVFDWFSKPDNLPGL